MKKYIMMVSCLLAGLCLWAGQAVFVHKNGVVIYDKIVSDVDSLKLQGGTAVFHVDGDGSVKKLKISEIDSLTFGELQEVNADGNIYITYAGNTVEVQNPYYASGLSVVVDGVEVTSAKETISGSNVVVMAATAISGLTYHIGGATSNGSLTMSTDKAFILSLENAEIANQSASSAINILTKKAATVKLVGSNKLSDAENSAVKAALYSKSELIFDEESTGSLEVTGNTKHAIFTSDLFQMNGGQVIVKNAESDGVHCDEFVVNGGSFSVGNAKGDCVDAEKSVVVSDGTLSLMSTADDAKGIKSNGTINILGGSVEMSLSGNGAKGMKTDTADVVIEGGSTVIKLTGTGYYSEAVDTTNIDTSFAAGIKTDAKIQIAGGTLNVSVAGQGGKALKTDGTVTISGGTNILATSGAPVAIDGDNKVSTVLRAGSINITGGENTLSTTADALGAKGMHADGDINITDGTVNVTLKNLFSTFTNASKQADSTMVACIKGEGNVSISGGNITLLATQNGKGINASGKNSVLTIGEKNADNSKLVLSITTQGNTSHSYQYTNEGAARTKFYGNPKGISCGEGTIVINSGKTTINSVANGVVDITAFYEGSGSSSSSSSFNPWGGGSSSSSGSGYKGFRGDTTVTINGGKLIIRNCYEGIEGFRINANGGVTEVVSTDDAWNATSSHISSAASSSSSSSSNPWSGGGFGGGGRGGFGGGGMSSSTGYLTIAGGAHYVYSGGDGIDSNGDLTISGGLVVNNQNGTGGNGIFDKGDNGNTLSASGNAVILGVGGSDMNESFSTSLNNTGYSSISVTNGNTLYVTSGGKVIAALKVKASSKTSAAIFLNNKYSGVSFSTSGTANFDRFEDIDGSAVFYIDPNLYNE